MTSCQSDKSTVNSDGKSEVSEVQKVDPVGPQISVSASGEETKTYCYELNDRGNRQNIKLIIEGDKVTGTYEIKSKEKMTGNLLGFFRDGDIISDFNYEINGKKHEEKIIITRQLTSARIARSGSLAVEGKREERNGGLATLETLQQKVCD